MNSGRRAAARSTLDRGRGRHAYCLGGRLGWVRTSSIEAVHLLTQQL
jgi:hypothetical protein